MIFEVSVGYTVANFLLALFIYIKSRRHLITKFYFFCVVSLVTFGVAAYFADHVSNDTVRVILEHTVIFLFALSPFFFLHFILVFARRYDILNSKNVIAAIYFAGLFSYTMILLGFLPRPITAVGMMTQTGDIFYITWMSIFFIIGIAMLYESTRGFYERIERANLLIGGFALLLLALPGPFTESVLIGIFHIHVDFYYIFSTLAVIVATYFVFRHKIIVNTVYDALKSALGVMKDVFITTDDHFQIQMVRGGLTPLLGFTEKEWIGQSFKEFIEEGDMLDEYRNFVLGGKMKESNFDAQTMKKNADPVPMNFSFTPMFVQDELRGFVGVGRDTTESDGPNRRCASRRQNSDRSSRTCPTAFFRSLPTAGSSRQTPRSRTCSGMIHPKTSFISISGGTSPLTKMVRRHCCRNS